MNLKACKVRHAWGDDYDLESWKKRPKYRTDEGLAIDARWAIVRDDELNAWVLIHRLTGFAASRCVKTKSAALKIVAAFYELYGQEFWDFTDPDTVRGCSGAKAIVRSLERG